MVNIKFILLSYFETINFSSDFNNYEILLSIYRTITIAEKLLLVDLIFRLPAVLMMLLSIV